MSNTQSLQFEALYKRVSERYKVIESLLTQLNERVVAEDRFSQQLDRVSGQMPTNGGDLDDLLQGAKVDLAQKASSTRQFAASFKIEIESGTNQLKIYQSQIKQSCQDTLRLDKEVKSFYDKYEKLREKYVKTCKDFEDLSVALEASMWNKEANKKAEQRKILNQRLFQQSTMRNEQEATIKQQIVLCNASMVTFNATVNTTNIQLMAIHGSLFGLAKDIMMKLLVFDISRQRNIQYDGEQFFKEVEKFQDPQQSPTSIVHGQQLLLAQSKDSISSSIQSPYTSFMKDISERILLSYKMKPIKVEEEEAPLDLYQLKSLAVQIIARNHNRPVQPDTVNLTAEGMIESSTKQEEMNDYVGFIKLSIQQSCDSEISDYPGLGTEFDVSQLQDLFVKKMYRELGVICLESYRTAGFFLFVQLVSIFQFSASCYKKIVYYVSRLIDGCWKENDLQVMKRLIIMISTLYKLSDDEQQQHIYLQEGLLAIKIWKQVDLWEGLIYTTMEEEMDKSGVLTNREQIFKDKTQIFSTLLSISLNMMNFKVEKAEVKYIISKYGKIFSLYDLQIQELMKFIESDGKVDVSSNINSISVLSTLYHSTPNDQTKSQIIGQQQQFVPKKVLTFEKRPQSQFVANPLANPLAKQPKKSEENIKIPERTKSELETPKMETPKVEEPQEESKKQTEDESSRISKVEVKKQEFQIESSKLASPPNPNVQPQQKKASFSEHPLEKPQKKSQFEQLQLEQPDDATNKKGFFKKLF